MAVRGISHGLYRLFLNFWCYEQSRGKFFNNFGPRASARYDPAHALLLVGITCADDNVKIMSATTRYIYVGISILVIAVTINCK